MECFIIADCFSRTAISDERKVPKPVTKKRYDYLIVGAGLTGAIFAREAARIGKSCLIIDKRDHIAGNIYTENREGIDVHVYGAHIFHTNDEDVWRYVNNFAEFNNFVNSPIANFHGTIYNMPFNMNTFHEIWNDVITPDQARERIAEQVVREKIDEPSNLEEQALSMVGRDIYEKLVKEYTEKQWGRDCRELPASIIKRLPCRFIYDNNYFNDKYQGIPVGGYTGMIERIIGNVDVILRTEYKDFIEKNQSIADKTVYCGPIDEYYDYKLGNLEYRSLRFESETLDEPDHQGNAVVNYTSHDHPFTRIIEHKHFAKPATMTSPTIITREYPADWVPGDEPYYPLNDEKNTELYKRYADLSEHDENAPLFAGRLGSYKYYDMDKAIAAAFELVRDELGVDLRTI